MFPNKKYVLNNHNNDIISSNINKTPVKQR